MSNVLAQRWLLNRRRFLRGAGAAVALPLLDAMTPLRAAPADKPRRSVFVYIPNGVNGMKWQVTKPGRDYKLSPSLEPLAKHRNDFTVFSGLHHPNGLGQAQRLRRHLADRCEDRRPERPEVREHHLLRPAHGRQGRASDPVPVAGAVHQRGHRAAGQLDHPGVLQGRRPPPRRGQPAPRLRPALRRGGRRASPPGATGSCGGGASSTPSTTTPRPSAASWGRATGRGSTNTSTPCATWSSGRPGSSRGWTCPGRRSPRRRPPPSSATCPRPRPANTGGPCST